MAPSVVLVPGLASLGSVFFAPLKTELESLGFADITIVNNPSVESVDELSKSQSNALQADIQHLQQTVQDLVDSSKDVIIAAHSYGGTVSLYASEGMWKHVRQAKGLQGGVVKAVLISSSLSLPGDSIAGDIAKWSTEHDPSILAAQQAARVETRNDVCQRFFRSYYLLLINY
jgi:pimeloyl-ACP methyl ester carboxylesterase